MQENFKTLAEDFSASPSVPSANSDFMKALLQLAQTRQLNETLGKQIQALAWDFVHTRSLAPFNRFSETAYVREYIGRDSSTGWEALVMCWKKGNRSAIHGHPQFAGYTFADGEFLVELFEPYRTGARLVRKIHITQPQSLYSIGEKDQFNNHIHRITCLSETAHSLHIYSDDALKGLKYEEIQG